MAENAKILWSRHRIVPHLEEKEADETKAVLKMAWQDHGSLRLPTAHSIFFS